MYFDRIICYKETQNVEFLFFCLLAKWWTGLTIITIGALENDVWVRFDHLSGRILPFYLHSYTVFRKIPESNFQKNLTIQSHNLKKVWERNSQKITMFLFQVFAEVSRIRASIFAHMASVRFHSAVNIFMVLKSVEQFSDCNGNFNILNSFCFVEYAPPNFSYE